MRGTSTTAPPPLRCGPTVYSAITPILAGTRIVKYLTVMLVLFILGTACTSLPATRDSSESDTGDGPVAHELDECTDVAGAEEGKARFVGHAGSDRVDPNVVLEAPLVFRTAADTDAWLKAVGASWRVTGVDFEQEQAVGYAWNDSMCAEVFSHELRAFAWANVGSSLVAVVEVSEASCGSSECGAALTGELWATPIADVTACRVGSICE